MAVATHEGPIQAFSGDTWEKDPHRQVQINHTYRLAVTDEMLIAGPVTYRKCRETYESLYGEPQEGVDYWV